MKKVEIFWATEEKWQKYAHAKEMGKRKLASYEDMVEICPTSLDKEVGNTNYKKIFLYLNRIK